MLPGNPRDDTNKLSFPPCNKVYIKILTESLETILAIYGTLLVHSYTENLTWKK